MTDSPDPTGRRAGRRAVLAGGAAVAAAAAAVAVTRSRSGDDRPLADPSAPARTAPVASSISDPNGIPRRRLGRIPFDASILSLGGAYLTDGPGLVEYAFDQGINLVDTAAGPEYNGSHRILAQVLPRWRDRVFVSDKIDAWDAAEARREVRENVRELGVEYVDAMLMHGINQQRAVDAVFAPGGAMEALLEAQRAGLVRYIGFSCNNPPVAAALVQRHDFDIVLVPVSPLNFLLADCLAALAPFRSQGFAVMGMKAIASGAITDLDGAFRWSFSQQLDTMTAGMSTRAHVDADVAIARAHTAALSPARQQAVVDAVRPIADPGRYYWLAHNVRR